MSEHYGLLEFDVIDPVQRGPRPLTLILLHGRGADRHDLVGLRAYLPPYATLVFPQAPFPGAPWGYGGGWAWYQYIAEDRPEPASFTQSLNALDALLEDVQTRWPAPVVLGGFSQGGTLSLAYALSRPGRVTLVINLSGFLAVHREVAVSPESVQPVQIFWGHGTSDPNIPFALAERGRAALRRAGARLEARDYAIGHWVDPTEIQDALRWAESRLLEAAPHVP